MSVPAPFQALVKLSLKHKEIKNTLSLDIKEDVLKMIEMMQAPTVRAKEKRRLGFKEPR